MKQEHHRELLGEIDAFRRIAGMAESTFGQKAVRDWTVVDRLRQGRVTMRTVERIRIFIKERTAEIEKARPRRRAS